MTEKVRLYPVKEKQHINKDIIMFWLFIFLFAIIFWIIGTATTHYPSVAGVI